ncbi:MAG TPA: FtsX-like permease family protein [Vicinamibacterales bacterium]|nr:FtsX-like permease family protein [Vicinamibacterales bacterium]
MLTHYLKTAWKVFLRRKFFTLISLFGISFTLVVLMVATALLDHVFAPYPPEVHQDRTRTVLRASMLGEHNTWNSGPGYRLLDKYARNLPGVERFSISSTPGGAQSFLGGRRITLQLRRTDAEYWRILEFDFLEGGPFNAQDVAEARFVAVINEATRDRLFGGKPALNQTFEADGQRFRVVGVVPDVPALRRITYADVWAPLTTSKTDTYENDVMGPFMGIALLERGASADRLNEEFLARLKQVELPDPKNYDLIIARFETTFENMASSTFGRRGEEESHAERLWAAIAIAGLLFMLLPTVNLVNLNVSRMMERASEIGVRKAFGASSRTLVGQFVVENVALSLVGGLAGFVLSAAALRGITATGLIPYAQLHLNPRIFLYGVAIAVFFGIFSGVYPAWRMSRLNPVQALKGSSR